MGFFVRLILSIVLAVALGVGSALWWLGEIAGADTVRNGAWSIDTSIGSAEAGLYTRAYVARVGLLALNNSEAIYFTATSDDSGTALSGDCTYRVAGSALPALWSSLTVYGADQFLQDTPEKRYSFMIAPISAEDGSFEIGVSARQTAGHWLPVRSGEPFLLMLRLYNPDPAVVADPTAFAAPRIVKESCP